MLTNELAKAVANFGAAVVAVSICRLGREFLRLAGGLRRFGEGTDFLDGADADAVGLAQSAVDSACFGDAHFGTVDKEGDVGRVGVAVTDESLARADL